MYSELKTDTADVIGPFLTMIASEERAQSTIVLKDGKYVIEVWTGTEEPSPPVT